MNRLRGRARFFVPRLFTHLSPSPSYTITHNRRVAAAAEILQIENLDHVIVGQGYFSFRKQEFWDLNFNLWSAG